MNQFQSQSRPPSEQQRQQRLQQTPPQRHGTLVGGIDWEESLRSGAARVDGHGKGEGGRKRDQGQEGNASAATGNSADLSMKHTPRLHSEIHGEEGGKGFGERKDSTVRQPALNAESSVLSMHSQVRSEGRSDGSESIRRWLQVRLVGGRWIDLSAHPLRV